VHELAITESLAELVAERTSGRRVVRVNVRVGSRSGLVPEAMRFCFDVVTAGTPIEGAELVIEETGGEELDLVSVELLRQPVEETSCA
jgi:hydrogenase nickel incorporation protein HypA/HybF